MANELVSKRFSAKAATYDQYAVVQQEMASILAKSIFSGTRQVQSLLEIGSGTAWADPAFASAVSPMRVCGA